MENLFASTVFGVKSTIFAIFLVSTFFSTIVFHMENRSLFRFSLVLTPFSEFSTDFFKLGFQQENSYVIYDFFVSLSTRIPHPFFHFSTYFSTPVENLWKSVISSVENLWKGKILGGRGKTLGKGGLL